MNSGSSVENSSLASWRPRYASVAVITACVGLALGYLFSQDTPVGRVQGQVVLQENGRPLAHTRLVLTPDTPGGSEDDDSTDVVHDQRRFRAVTDASGFFSIPKIPAGFYAATAYTRAHSVKQQYVTVSEGATSDVTLHLWRSQPDLQMTQHQRVFLSSEKVSLPVHGYVDGARPSGRDTLHVRVFRTRLSQVLQHQQSAAALQTVGQSWQPPSHLPPDLMHPTQGAQPQLVSERDVPVTEADAEGFFNQRVKLDTPGPGLYLMDVTLHGHTACAWAQVTDTALITKKARRQVVAFLVDMKTGEPRAGTPVRVYHQGQVIAQGMTSASGVANLDLPATEAESKLMTVALQGDDEGVVSQYDYEHEDQGNFTVHAYTDRPVYRPGQRIYYKGIARRVVEAGSRYTVPARQAIEVEVRDPSGERLLHQTETVNRYGAFHGSLDLSPEAPTGGYEMIMTTAGEKHTQDIMVAAYRKPEYEVTVTPGQKRYTNGDPVDMFVSAQFYFGAPVAGAKVHYEINRAVDWASEYADQYGASDDQDQNSDEPADAEFRGESDDTGGGSGEMVTDGDVTLDANGHAIIHFDSNAQTDDSSRSNRHAAEASDESAAPPQSQIFTANVTVKDTSGREITAEGDARVTAGDFHLTVVPAGYVAEPRERTQVQVIARDYDGHPVPNLPLQLDNGYEEWISASDNREEQSSFKQVGVRHAVTGPDGKAIIDLIPPRTGDLQLQARATDTHGHPVEAHASLWVTRDGEDSTSAHYTDLALLTDKKRYAAGDTARVLVNSKNTGQTILLALEGNRIYRTFTVTARQRSTTVQVPILGDYGPNVYLTACYVKDKNFARSEIPLRVAVPQRQVTVKVHPDKAKYRPGEKATYQVQTVDAKGQPIPCEFSFGVVDEAIYAIRPDDPTALRNEFYPHRENAVNTGYSFAEEYLGDADKGAPQIVARKRFPDTAYWQPCLETGQDGRATVSFNLPDNLTTWRATAVAQTLDTAFGRATNKVVEAKDFFVRLETPRFLTQGDESRLMAFVHNETGAPQTAQVRIDAAGLTIHASATQSLTLQPGQVGQAVWPVSTDLMGTDVKGTSHIRLTAWTNKSADGVQYSDGLDNTLPIKPHGREEITTTAGEITDGSPVVQTLTVAPGTMPGVNQLTVRLSPSLASALVGALDYLVGFPYGCTEQTMSRFLPDIMVHRVLRLSHQQSPKLDAQLPKMVRDGLSRLYRFQHEKGDWGWWEQDSSDPGMTAYVLYGLTIAKDEGYPVSDKVLARAVAATAALAKQPLTRNKYAPYYSENRPFLLYALALAGDHDTARSAASQLNLNLLGAEELAYMVLLDRQVGGTGKAAFSALESQLVSDDDGHWHWKGYGSYYDSESDDITATAAGMQALLAMNPTDPRISSVLLWLTTHRTGDNWETTRSTSWVLIALSDYLRHRPEATGNSGNLRVLLNGRTVQNCALTPNQEDDHEIVLHVPATALRTGPNQLALQRSGGTAPALYTVQFRQTVAMETLSALAPSGMTIQREYLRVAPRQAGQDRWSLQAEPTNNHLQQGDSIRVRLTLNVPHDMSYVLLEDPFPANCEVTERGNAGEHDDEWNYWWSNTDVRDDRIAFFMRTLTKGKHVVEYNLRPQTPGRCRALPTMLQAMYAPQMRAESAETQVEVQ